MTFSKKIIQNNLRLIFWLIGLGLGFGQAWSQRFTPGVDIISYLDMGDAFIDGNWNMAFNGLWSPLYAWVLGMANFLINPSPYWEYPLVQLVNFIVFIFAFYCFDLFLIEFIRFSKDSLGGPSDQDLPDWVWLCLGYTLFLWSSIDLIKVSQTNPDMMVAAFVYLAFAILFCIQWEKANWILFPVLGGALGLAYLSKSFMFLLSLIIIIITALLVWRDKKRIQKISMALGAFLLVAIPFIMGLSIQKGYVTFGEAGRLNYGWHVNGATRMHWQGETPNSGKPLHPTRKMFVLPETYEFAQPIGGTYPPWFDPCYWYEGLRVYFNPIQQVKALIGNLKEFSRSILLGINGGIAFSLLFLLLMCSMRRQAIKETLRYWFLIIPSIAAISLFMMVHVEDRYTAPFLIVMLLIIFFGFFFTEIPGKDKVAKGIVLGLLILFLIWTVPKQIFTSFVGRLDNNGDSLPWQVAESLKGMGLKPGDKVASLTFSIGDVARWARLAKVRIVAEVYHSKWRPPENNFWKMNPSTQNKILESFKQAGAKAVFSPEKPWNNYMENWQPIVRTPYYIYLFKK